MAQMDPSAYIAANTVKDLRTRCIMIHNILQTQTWRIRLSSVTRYIFEILIPTTRVINEFNIIIISNPLEILSLGVRHILPDSHLSLTSFLPQILFTIYLWSYAQSKMIFKYYFDIFECVSVNIGGVVE